MNKRGQIGAIIWFVFLYIGLASLWFAWLGEFFGQVGADYVAAGNTGGGAFFFTHLNLWFWMLYCISLMVATAGASR